MGTASWADKPLLESGRFYPPDANTPEKRLRFYASQFPVVEVDSTYYSLPERAIAAPPFGGVELRFETPVVRETIGVELAGRDRGCDRAAGLDRSPGARGLRHRRGAGRSLAHSPEPTPGAPPNESTGAIAERKLPDIQVRRG